MTSRLLRVTLLLLVGYGLCWADRAYGHAPLLLFGLVAAVSWLGGAAHASLPLTLAVAAAHRERDEIAARLAEIEDGGKYIPHTIVDSSLRKQVIRFPRPRPDGAA